TAANAWGLVTVMFADACASKRLEFRVRTDNPCANVRGPDAGVAKAKVYLYPSEFLQLVSCREIPLARRQIYAVAVYTCTRAGELHMLRCEDLDLGHATVHVHRAIDRRTGAEKPTKGRQARRFRLEPAIVPVLRHLVDRA